MMLRNNILTIGPSKVPVNGNIWGTVASNRVLPEVPPGLSSLLDPLPSRPSKFQQTFRSTPTLQQAYCDPINYFPPGYVFVSK